MNKAIKIFGILSFSLLICSAGLFNNVNTTQAHGDDDGHDQGQVAGAVTTNGTVNEALRKDINRENGNLYSQLSKYSSAKKKGPELDKLIAIAKVRKEKMLEQARTNPTDFLNTALPASTYNKLPKEVQDLTEKGIQIQGKLRVTHVHGVNGEVLPNRYEITDSNTKRDLDLYIGKGEIPMDKNGSVVKVNGLYLDSSVVMSDANSQAAGTGLTYLQTVPNPPTTMGPQNTLIIPIAFTDTPSTKPFSPQDLKTIAFTGPRSVNNFFQTISYGQFTYVGDVTPWITVPYTTADCDIADHTEGITQALAEVSDAGYDLNSYSRYAFFFPIANCKGAGSAASGNMVDIFQGTGIDTSALYQPLTHELGHAVKIDQVGHANSIDCGTKMIDLMVNCTVNEYGDPFDVMGTGLFEFNAPHRNQVGWIPASRIQTITSNGTYTVSPLENTTGIQILKIANPAWNANYNIEYRQPISYDSQLPFAATSGAGILIDHVLINQTGRADATPGDNNLQNPTLSDGQTFVDSVNGITIKQLSHNSSGVTVQVTFTAQGCKLPPTVTASPASQNGSVGQYLTYNVTIVDNDSSSCTNSNFGIDLDSVGTQAGLKINTAVQTGIMAPGSTITVPVKVYPSSITNTGSLNFALTAKDLGDNTHSASSQQLTYNVAAGCTRITPSLTILNPAVSGQRGDTVKINVTVKNNDIGSCPSSTITVGPNGTPNGWTVTSVDVTLAPGATSNAEVSVTSSMDAVAVNTLGLKAIDNGVNGHNSYDQSFTYTINGLNCVQSPSTMSITSPNLSGNAGDTLNFALKVTNNDSAECNTVPKQFDVVGLPAGFTSQFLYFSQPPHSTFTNDQSVTAPANAAKGTYNFTIYLSDHTTGAHITSVPVSFTVLGNPSCSLHQVSATVTPSTQSGNKGESLHYNVAINNSDALDCADTSFVVTGTNLPSGFTTDSQLVKVVPGTSATTTLTITSPMTATLGSNTFGISIKSGTNPLHAANLTATYNVAGTATCVRAKPTLNITPSSQLGNPLENSVYDVFITNNDSFSCPNTTFKLAVDQNSFILSSSMWTPNITLAPGATGDSIFSIYPNSGTTGSNVFSVNSSDSSEPLHTATGTATFVTKTAADCSRYTPTITLNPNSATSTAGQVLNYTATVTNNDTQACASSGFDVFGLNLPAGFVSTTTTKTIAPGSTMSFPFSITASPGAINGTYNFSATAANYSILNHVAFAVGTIVISNNTVCNRNAPSVNVSPSSQTGQSGQGLNYNVNITNNDSPGCANSTFAISATGLASGFTNSTSTTSSLAPGASTSNVITITSPSGASNGTNNFNVVANDPFVVNHTGSSSATYVVNNPIVCNRFAPTISLSPTSQTGAAGTVQNYTATVSNKDSSGCASSVFSVATSNLPNGFTASSNPSSLTIAAGGSGSTTISVASPSSALNGSNSFTASANDNSVSNHTASVNGTYTVNNPVVCTRRAPYMNLSPTSNTGAAGSSQTYTATLYNYDDNACPSTTFNMSSSLPSGFTSSFSPASFSLAGGNFKTVTVSVTSPSSAVNGTNNFTVTGADTSISNHSASVSGSYTVNNPVVCTRRAPLMNLSPTSNTGAAGSTQTYTATLYNYDDNTCPSSTFNITTSLPSGFTSSSSPTSFSLAGGNFKTVTVSVTSPSYATNGSNSFTVNAADTSISNHTASAAGTYTVNNPVVCTRRTPMMNLSPTSNTGAAGSGQTYTATLYNYDDNTCPSTTFNMSSSLPSGFTSSFSPASFSLPGGNFKTVTVSVTSPSYASNGTSSFTVTASDTSISNHSATASGSYVVNNPVACTRRAPYMSLSPTSNTGAAGSSQGYTATVYNNDDNACPSSNFNITASLPSGFTSSSSPSSFSLPGGNFKTVTVYVTSPSYAANGTNSFTVSAADTSVSNHTASASGTYTVNTVVACTRRAPYMSLSPTSATGAAGSTQTYTATLYNNDDNACPSTTFNMSSSLPGGFASSFSPASFSLPGGNFKAVTVYVTSPSYASNGTNNFTISAADNSISNHSTSASGTYTVNTVVACTRRAPDATIYPTYTAGVIGTTTSFTVTVYNNDDNACPSTNFNILVSDLPAQITNSVSLPSFTLPGGNFKTLTVNLTSLPNTVSNFYAFNVTVADNTIPNHSFSTSASIYEYSPTSMDSRVRGDSTTVPGYADQMHAQGTLIKMDGTYYIASEGGLIGIPSVEVLQSWGYSLSQAVEGNSADQQLFQIKVLSFKQPGQVHPWD